MAERGLSRRDFLQVSGGIGIGLVVSFSVPLRSHAKDAPAGGELTAFIRVAPDGSLVMRLPKSEMGQGVLTSLAMLLAEELDVDWAKISSEHAIADEQVYGRWTTGGSSSVRTLWEPLRQAGATARELLISAAAEYWGVARERCRAESGGVIHDSSGRRLAYEKISEHAATLRPPDEIPPLKPRQAFRLIGKDVRRLDTPSKVDGSAVFGIDVRLPGMLYAQVMRPPDLGGGVKSFDPAAALAVEGVRAVVEIPNGVAVVATSFWAAHSGRQKLAVSWKPGPHAALDNAAIRARCRAALDQGKVLRNEGDVTRALAAAERRVEAIYEFPYLAHATLEPMNCTAKVDAKRCEIWAPTQSPTQAAESAMQITGLSRDRIRVNTTLLGGGFGRRSATDFVEDAVHLSRHVKAPVQVIYTREDDMRSGLFRPVGANALSGGVDEEGWPIAWHHRIASQSIMASKGMPLQDGVDRTSVEGAHNLPYAIPNLRVSWTDVPQPVSTHWWRSVGSSQNAWVTECFFDELCAAGGKDPVEARLRLLGNHPRHARALKLAAREAGWSAAAPPGRARGVAVHESFRSIVAQVAEVSLDPDGTPRVHRVVCVVDCGEVVHPDGVRAQMESGITMGLSAALWGEVAIENGRIATANYDRYPILRIGQVPRIETHIIAQGDPMGGIGEPGTPPIAPAVCNALLRLTGSPVRRLPIGRITRSA